MRTSKLVMRYLLILALVLQSSMHSTASAEKIFVRVKRAFGEAAYHGKEPASCKDSAIECLAENIDWLEHHLGTYGSIAIKQPDIWGEARLTKHRDEFERVLFQELGKFEVRINAAISQGDSAFLSQALALSSAASGTDVTPASDQAGPSVVVAQANAKLANAEAPSLGFQSFGITAEPDKPGISLEPVIQLDQLSRYLQHLHELRRINEGDDTSDSPGYSLNLVRIPVSILPGKLTRTGFGAEVTVTATPVLSDDLLPTTFRNLVINDVVDQLGLMLVKTVENYDEIERQLDASDDRYRASKANLVDDSDKDSGPDQRSAGASVFSSPATGVRNALLPLNPTAIADVMWMRNILKIADFYRKAYGGRYVRWSGQPSFSDAKSCPLVNEHRVNLLDARRFLRAELAAAYELLTNPAHVRLFAELASPNSGLATSIRGEHYYRSHGGPPSVNRLREYFLISLHKHEAGVNEHNVAVQHESFIESDALHGVITDGSAYYEYVKQVIDTEKLSMKLQRYDAIVAKTSTEALAWAIVVESALLNERLNRDVRKVATAKGVYSLNTGQTHDFFLPDTVDEPGRGLEDLQGRFQEATQVFQEYVRARWPIHVFAIDPREQDQNVADVSQRKRELQFALALGFATGKIGGNSLTQFSRDLETQIETISLNRTIVGFGHGSDTFGWRFQPRVQALPVPGTLGAIRETLMGTSRDYDLRNRQLEAGQRECIALVLMPSFVPYADFDVRTNWFKLTNPKNAALTMRHTMRLSRAITSMRNSRAQCARCQHLYREGELSRLFRRVDQLDRELPLQTLRAQVPYENTLGGFEMFNSGVTDLAPQLVGWYGAPGVAVDKNGTNTYACGCAASCSNGMRAALVECTCENDKSKARTQALPACEGEGTSLFLVGDNFSVHDTRVIAGGVCIPHVQLVSREIMRVTIPSCVNTVKICENGMPNEYVAIYVSTPYGITNHLHVPIHIRPATTPANPTPSPAGASVEPIPAPLPHSSVSRLPRPFGSQSAASMQQPIHYTRTPIRRTQNVALGGRSHMLVHIQDDPFFDAVQLQTELADRISNLEVVAAELRAAAEEQPPIAFAVNVQPPIVNAVTEPRHLEHKQHGPIMTQMKTSIGEHWRNLRDHLPSQ